MPFKLTPKPSSRGRYPQFTPGRKRPPGKHSYKVMATKRAAKATSPFIPLDKLEPEPGQRVVVTFAREGLPPDKPGYQLGRWGKAKFPPGLMAWMNIPDAPAPEPELEPAAAVPEATPAPEAATSEEAPPLPHLRD